MSIDPLVGEVIEAARVSESKFNSLQSLSTLAFMFRGFNFF